MSDLLIELFSEEIPARMQARAREDLKSLVTNGLVEAGLTYASAGAFSTPRRLTLAIDGLAAHSAPVREERKGPAATAPEAAIQGFLRATGLTLDQLERRRHHRPVGVAGEARRRQVRRLGGDIKANQGFADSIGLAVSSLGWEARIALRRDDFIRAIDLYLEQAAAGDEGGFLHSIHSMAAPESKPPLHQRQVSAM